MFSDSFNERTRANMEVALDRACKLLDGDQENHEARKEIAQAILNAAKSGEGGLDALTRAAINAARQHSHSTLQ